jgi:hypothetical protein
MHVRLIRDWRRFAAGTILELDLGVADMLIRRHYAESLPTGPAVERAVADVPRGDCEPKPRRFKK